MAAAVPVPQITAPAAAPEAVATVLSIEKQFDEEMKKFAQPEPAPPKVTMGGARTQEGEVREGKTDALIKTGTQNLQFKSKFLQISQKLSGWIDRVQTFAYKKPLHAAALAIVGLLLLVGACSSGAILPIIGGVIGGGVLIWVGGFGLLGRIYTPLDPKKFRPHLDAAFQKALREKNPQWTTWTATAQTKIKELHENFNKELDQQLQYRRGIDKGDLFPMLNDLHDKIRVLVCDPGYTDKDRDSFHAALKALVGAQDVDTKHAVSEGTEEQFRNRLEQNLTNWHTAHREMAMDYFKEQHGQHKTNALEALKKAEEEIAAQNGNFDDPAALAALHQHKGMIKEMIDVIQHHQWFEALNTVMTNVFKLVPPNGGHQNLLAGPLLS